MSDADLNDQLKIGVMCYLHLWASLHKHVQVSHDEIANGIGLWDDHGGGYFASFTIDNARMMQANQTYVCALGDGGPMVGQLEKIPPCTPLMIDKKTLFLLNALAQSGQAQSAETSMKQVDVITTLIATELNARGTLRRKSLH